MAGHGRGGILSRGGDAAFARIDLVPMPAKARNRSSMHLLRCVLLALTIGWPAMAEAHDLMRGTAVIEPLALRELDRTTYRDEHGRAAGFSLRRILAPDSKVEGPLSSSELFALPSMRAVRGAIDGEFARYIAQQQAAVPDLSIGVGEGHGLQLFDRAWLDSSHTRFALAGIVNRMARGFVSPATCGEIRLIYRLVREDAKGDEPRRLPMTLNVVMKARGAAPSDRGSKTACAEIARRWLATSDQTLTGAALAAKLTSPQGPLVLIEPANVDRIEFNLQIAHIARSADHDFRTDYLLKVFRFAPAEQSFVDAPLENQLDRERLMADPQLGDELRQWLLAPEQMRALDRGTILIPEKYLATAALAPTPVGFVNSKLLPGYGLLQPDDAAGNAVFRQRDVVAALARAVARGVKFENIRSVAGFERRLNDMTCAGCHQTRGIGGFHFPGVDWMADAPSNTTTVPASPHFIGDQVRRRDILAAVRDGERPDYSRGFSSRPQLRGDGELRGTEYDNGWGAHCYRSPAHGRGDSSFRSWSCAKGLACQVIGTNNTERMGMCFVSNR